MHVRGKKPMLRDQRQRSLFVALILGSVNICGAALPGSFSAGLSSPHGEFLCVTLPVDHPPTHPPCPPGPTCLPLLPRTACWVSMGPRPNKQTNRTTWKPITQTRLVWAGGEMKRHFVCSVGQFHFTVREEKASQDMTTSTSV